ncbi:class I SAM-dependent methyltransferase [Jiangella endophytica]|uniref:class I SAM-dependent methyltransferase n=1 Tax=Jiangella endophytica TaxID=1623398 RepID=UPI000E346AAD|nr:class I SAM-dependent methyltransferase [Jiangella endophytica]
MAGADLRAVYEAGDEDGRMLSERNRVEWERTCELLLRWLPDPPARLLDVGGASGRYAEWLEELGHRVEVVDLVPWHVEQARARGLRAEVGDARELPQPDGSMDAVLLLGPLYHLPEAPGRLQALAEARRVCRPGGVVVAAAMSRWAKPAVRAARGELADPEIQRHLDAVLRHGHDDRGNEFDLVSYNHDPEELRGELSAAGLTDVVVAGIEGPLGAAAREDTTLNDLALRTARIAEHAAPHLSIHLLAGARTPTQPR